MAIAPITEVIDDIRQGRVVILMDNARRENEGDFVLAADFVTVENLNFLTVVARGLLCVAITHHRARTLQIPLLKSQDTQLVSHVSMAPFSMTVDAAEGVTTGISVPDRVRTIQVLTAEDTQPEDLLRPGHIQPLIAQEGGVLVRVGHTEGAIDLVRLAGVRSGAAILCELLRPDGLMARLPDIEIIAAEHGIKIGSIDDLVRHRCQTEVLLTKIKEQGIETSYGFFTACCFQHIYSGFVYLALVKGDLDSVVGCVPVAVHTQVSWLTLFDTQWPFSVVQSLQRVSQESVGVILLIQEPDTRRVSRDFVLGGQNSRWCCDRASGVAYQMLQILRVSRVCFLGDEQYYEELKRYSFVDIVFRGS